MFHLIRNWSPYKSILIKYFSSSILIRTTLWYTWIRWIGSELTWPESRRRSNSKTSPKAPIWCDRVFTRAASMCWVLWRRSRPCTLWSMKTRANILSNPTISSGGASPKTTRQSSPAADRDRRLIINSCPPPRWQTQATYPVQRSAHLATIAWMMTSHNLITIIRIVLRLTSLPH